MSSSPVHFTGGTEVFHFDSNASLGEHTSRAVWRRGKRPRPPIPPEFASLKRRKRVRSPSGERTLVNLSTGKSLTEEDIKTGRRHLPADLHLSTSYSIFSGLRELLSKIYAVVARTLSAVVYFLRHIFGCCNTFSVEPQSVDSDSDSDFEEEDFE